MIKLLHMEFGGVFSYPAKMQSFYFKPGFHLLVGNTGSGKSSFLNLIPLALFDKSPALEKSWIINEHEPKGFINLTFQKEDEVYDIHYWRSLSKLEWSLSKGEQLIITGSTTGDYIEKLLGFDYDQLINAFYLTQNGSTTYELFYGDPADRLRILSRVFGLERCMNVAEYAKEQVQVLEGECLALEVRQAEIQGALQSIKSDSALTCAGLEQDILERKKQLFEYQLLAQNYKQGVESIQREKQDALSLMLQQERSLRDMFSATEKLLINEQRALELEQVYVNRQKLYYLGSIKYGEDIASITLLQAQIDESYKMLGEDYKYMAVYEAEDQRLLKLLGQIKQGQGKCEYCGSEVSAAQLEQYQIENQRAKIEVVTCMETRSEIIAISEDALGVLQKNLSDLEKSKREFEKAFPEDSTYWSRNVDLSLLERAVVKRDKELKSLKEAVDKTSKENGGMSGMYDIEIKRIQEQLNVVNESCQGLEYQIKSLNKDLQRLKNKQLEWTDLNSQRAIVWQNLTAQKKEQALNQWWVTGFKELATLRLYGYIEGVNKRIEEMLKPWGMNCWIDVLEEKKNVKDQFSLDSFKRKVKIFVSAPGKSKTPLEGYSGGEKQLLALAMLLSVGTIVGDFNFIALDEVFGSLDPDLRPQVAEMLNQQKHGGIFEDKCVMLITHDLEMKGALDIDSVAHVTKENDCSNLTVEEI